MNTESFGKPDGAARVREGMSPLADFINLTDALIRLDAGDPSAASSRIDRLLELNLVECERGALSLTSYGRRAIGLRQ